MNAPDPANTFSGNLPSLPPGIAAVLDKRFPLDTAGEREPFFDAMIEGSWGTRDPRFLKDEIERAAGQRAVAAVVGEERFVQPLPPIDLGPAALPPPPIPVVPYQELAETTLTHEWDTGPGTAVLTVDEEPRAHRRRGPSGRFISRAATGGT